MNHWIKIDGTLVNLNNIVAVQNRDEMGFDYSGHGWLMLTIAVQNRFASDETDSMDYIWFPDKTCVRAAYEWLKSQCVMTFEDKKGE